jgi:hypothetical protein
MQDDSSTFQFHWTLANTANISQISYQTRCREHMGWLGFRKTNAQAHLLASLRRLHQPQVHKYTIIHDCVFGRLYKTSLQLAHSVLAVASGRIWCLLPCGGFRIPVGGAVSFLRWGKPWNKVPFARGVQFLSYIWLHRLVGGQLVPSWSLSQGNPIPFWFRLPARRWSPLSVLPLWFLYVM